MKRLALLLTLALASCIPTFDPAQPQELTVRYDGLTLTLTSDKPIERGSIGIRSGGVLSPYCDPCIPDADGVTLLRILEQPGQDYSTVLELGEVTGLERLRVVAVRVGEARAIVRTFVLAEIEKPPGTP